MTRYMSMCRDIVKDRKSLYTIREKAFKAAHSGSAAVIFIVSWSSLVLIAFYASYDFMKGFGVTSKHDIWWYNQFVGVAVYSYFTSIGFLLVFRALSLTFLFLPIETKINPYHSDGRGGLSVFGSILSNATLMFSSGALFIPILSSLHIDTFSGQSPMILLLIAVYTVMIAISFILPVWLIHKKMSVEKGRMLAPISERLMELDLIKPKLGASQYRVYRVLRDRYSDITQLPTWPVNLSNIMTVFSSIALPIALTVLQIKVASPSP